MYRVLISSRSCYPECRHASLDYPMVVVVIAPDGSHKQPVECRSVREAYIYANGICHGAMTAAPNDKRWPVNPELAEHLKAPA